MEEKEDFSSKKEKEFTQTNSQTNIWQILQRLLKKFLSQNPLDH